MGQNPLMSKEMLHIIECIDNCNNHKLKAMFKCEKSIHLGPQLCTMKSTSNKNSDVTLLDHPSI